ncbi:MAG: sulfite reductase subunit alpha [Steroidobacteraceae bacterium]
MILGLSNTRLLAACIAIALYLLLCGATIYRQRRKQQQTASAAASLIPAAAGTPEWLVIYASQNGNAEQLAWQTARALHTAGIPARVMSMAKVKADILRTTERALFVVSTYGEGDPPDDAALFTRKLIGSALPLPQLHYGLLALGDRTYQNFCGFGRTLDQWLQAQQAQPLFERIEVDNDDQAALHQWQHHLSHIAGTSDIPDWQAPAYERWQLAARQHLNPGSAGAACFHIELEPTTGSVLPQWHSGDLVQIHPPADPQRPRDYSIASIPADGRVHLLIRQERRSDGTLGLASGWLTELAAIGEVIELRLRAHANFQLGENAQRPLILIGNGTGLAGLRSHLKTRAAMSQQRNWLIFGERNAAYDRLYGDELQTWHAQGVLTRTDLVFSRDQEPRRYVQDQLREAAIELRQWVQEGAAIYVCGSLEGMAAGVETALNNILGSSEVEQLIEAGRYRRDVY